MKSGFAFLGLGLIAIAAAVFFFGPKSERVPDYQDNESPSMTESALKLTSPAFKDGAAIPAKYTCDGERFTSPPLTIYGVPEGTKSLVLLMDDPDVPKELVPSGVFDHWVLYAIPPEMAEIPEGAQGIGTAGANGRDALSYTGPCPPTEYEPTEHRYFFRLYALSGTLNFVKAPTKDEVLQAMQGMILAEAELMGTYDRAQ
jgi:Raf kinase inhibitor-like YbhB/YbcL family protein